MPANTKSFSRFKGLNNVSDPLRMSSGWMSIADNINIDDTGAIVRREGYARALAGTISGAFSRPDFSDMFLVSDGALCLVSEAMTLSTLRTGLSTEPMQWGEVNDNVFFTNGVDAGIITPANEVIDWTWPVPSMPNVSIVTGGLPAGTYQVCCTFLLADGRETGAGDVATVTIAAGQAFQVSSLPEFAGAATVTYIAPADSTVFQEAHLGADAFLWNSSPDLLGVGLMTQFLSPLPAGASHPVFWNGRMYVMQRIVEANTTAIWASKPLAFHLFDLAQDVILVPGLGTMLASCDAGMVIGTDNQIYTFDGDKLKLEAEYGAVPGWGAVEDVESGSVLFWSTRGLCSVLPFANLTERQISVPPGTNVGAVIMEKDGQKRFIASLNSGGSAFNARKTVVPAPAITPESGAVGDYPVGDF